MTYPKYKYKEFVLVPAFKPDSALGRCRPCVADRHPSLCRTLQAQAPRTEWNHCTNVVWIKDTDEARAAYLAERLSA